MTKLSEVIKHYIKYYYYITNISKVIEIFAKTIYKPWVK